MNYFETKNIKTKTKLVLFLRCLKEDYVNNKQSWENRDIPEFLEAMAAWMEDMEGFYVNQGLSIPERPDWEMFANILMGGKTYE